MRKVTSLTQKLDDCIRSGEALSVQCSVHLVISMVIQVLEGSRVLRTVVGRKV